jgi:hypothetical protein
MMRVFQATDGFMEENVPDTFNSPDYENAWHAQSRIAKVYKFMMMDGIMPEQEAEAAMTAVYEKLIANFPGCPAAGRASKWLEIYAISTEGGQ